MIAKHAIQVRSICAETPRSLSDQLSMGVYALNNGVHQTMGFTPFYLNGLRHIQVVLTLRGGADASISISSVESNKLVHHFIEPFANLYRHNVV
ncbi:Reverse transcriptase [Phytophthora palmivora]|uniref:Reverse transcriptase n=1 Tax=Phytophthora palmivora TaxID=4796 RepID=A0A2P4Y3J3_9STRA|nr:Reverse transcriptase [Phytophthora palmivora]